MLQWIQGCLCSFESVFWVPLAIFPEVGLLGQKADAFLSLEGCSLIIYRLHWVYEQLGLDFVRSGLIWSALGPRTWPSLLRYGFSGMSVENLKCVPSTSNLVNSNSSHCFPCGEQQLKSHLCLLVFSYFALQYLLFTGFLGVSSVCVCGSGVN